MSSFEQAVAWMRAGKKVQRKSWEAGNAISSASVFLVYPDDLSAEDWETYETIWTQPEKMKRKRYGVTYER